MIRCIHHWIHHSKLKQKNPFSHNNFIVYKDRTHVYTISFSWVSNHVVPFCFYYEINKLTDCCKCQNQPTARLNSEWKKCQSWNVRVLILLCVQFWKILAGDTHTIVESHVLNITSVVMKILVSWLKYILIFYMRAPTLRIDKSTFRLINPRTLDSDR